MAAAEIAEDIRDTANYRIENTTEAIIEIPAVPGLEIQDRIFGTRLDKDIVGAPAFERTVSGKILKALFGRRIFSALVERGDLAVSSGRLVIPTGRKIAA